MCSEARSHPSYLSNVLHLLTLCKGAKALGLDVRLVNKQVTGAIRGRDEAVALGAVEPGGRKNDGEDQTEYGGGMCAAPLNVRRSIQQRSRAVPVRLRNTTAHRGSSSDPPITLPQLRRGVRTHPPRPRMIDFQYRTTFRHAPGTINNVGAANSPSPLASDNSCAAHSRTISRYQSGVYQPW